MSRSEHCPDSPIDGDEGPLPWWRRACSMVVTIATVGLALFLWPALLGGETRLVVVAGHSMEPTYDLGDVVIARDTDDTEVGDIVVFEVPTGTAEGLLVIHRVVDVDDAGRFITRGDNRDTDDVWPLTERDIVGEPLLHIPHGGVAMKWFSDVRVLALLAGLAAAVVLWPGRDERDERDVDDEIEFVDPIVAELDDVLRAASIEIGADPGPGSEWFDAVLGDVDEGDAHEVDVDEDDALVDGAIDDDVMADAEAWLDEQLALH